jgi:hypothetical protein
MSVVRSLQKVGKVTMAQVQNANGSLGGHWLSAINIAEQTVMNNVRTLSLPGLICGLTD